MKGLYTVLLLVCSNHFRTFAWYGHCKAARDESDQQLAAHRCYPDIVGMAFSSIRPPNPRQPYRFSSGNGGPFTLVQLKVIQEVITPLSFLPFSTMIFSGRNIKMESPGSGSMSGNGRIFCIYEIKPIFRRVDRFYTVR